eukprot:scaffold1405_cov93-Isochrysis_galbana.AAC.2
MLAPAEGAGLLCDQRSVRGTVRDTPGRLSESRLPGPVTANEEAHSDRRRGRQGADRLVAPRARFV